ncbi:PREDICTED: uncharacterized protein LOC106783681 isoform X2 [Polistes canadensis]|uniref:uncharacterized protein LOC106783681 isoform X2 n=1 Tax=Polistes canadensis TaxID=91411 RepID=UPI000718C34D|nr:PREDICTED: uncharacterized protein LOC106783681 isoform X2 [Polistes canadensis]
MDSIKKVRRSEGPRTKQAQPKSPSDKSPPSKVPSRDLSPKDNLLDDPISVQIPEELPCHRPDECTRGVTRGSSRERRLIAEIQEPVPSDSDESLVNHLSHVESAPKQYRIGDTLLYFLLHPHTIPPKTFKSSMELWWNDRWVRLIDPPDSLTLAHFYHCIPDTATNMEAKDAVTKAGRMLYTARLKRHDFKADPIRFAREQATLSVAGSGQSAKLDLEKKIAKLDLVINKFEATAEAFVDSLVVLQRLINRKAELSRSAITDGIHNFKHIMDKTVSGFDDVQWTPIGQLRPRSPEPSTSAAVRSEPPPPMKSEPKTKRVYSRPK